MSTIPGLVTREPQAPLGSLHEILVPTDLSDAADAAVEQAAILSGRLGGRVTLYHALEFPDHEYGHWAFGERPCVWDQQERLARDHLADCAEPLAVPHAAVVERTASPLRALLSRIEATRPDLTVMSTLGRSGLAHLLLGSVAEQVVEQTRWPVLCVRGTEPIDRGLSGRIVLDTDCSDASRPALDLSMTLARRFGGELVVVCGPASHHAPWARVDMEEPWRPYATAERWLSSPPQDLTIRVVADTTPGGRGALRIAVEMRAGLLVTSRKAHARGAAGEATRLVRHAHCPVLVA
jgi:nucleotide-binding universal stress UspA family protein